MKQTEQGKVLTPRKDCKVDQDKILGTNLGFLKKSRKMVQKDYKTRKNEEIHSKNEIIGPVLDFPKQSRKQTGERFFTPAAYSPSGFGLWTFPRTPFTMIHPRLFHPRSHSQLLKRIILKFHSWVIPIRKGHQPKPFFLFKKRFFQVLLPHCQE